MSLIIAIPIGVLCLYLSWLCIGKNSRTSLVLFLVGCGALGGSFLMILISWLFWPEFTSAMP
ncbi:hypothetical protein [Trichloromonas sp.]|uniref:hypothetical protein n=1 Tax=Trichloromonas sp. TaxID=3069249 RepID=UPI002A3DE0AA|nr:hypothetical protein [Trichloromonas sp.]